MGRRHLVGGGFWVTEHDSHIGGRPATPVCDFRPRYVALIWVKIKFVARVVEWYTRWS